MDTVQFEELKNLLLEIASLQKESTPPRTSYVVKKKGQLFQVDELRVTEDIPKDVNPKEYAVTEALDLLEKAKVNNFYDLVGIPVEATIDGQSLKEWRILEEVL